MVHSDAEAMVAYISLIIASSCMGFPNDQIHPKQGKSPRAQEVYWQVQVFLLQLNLSRHSTYLTHCFGRPKQAKIPAYPLCAGLAKAVSRTLSLLDWVVDPDKYQRMLMYHQDQYKNRDDNKGPMLDVCDTSAR
jgi:hypothetical protein